MLIFSSPQSEEPLSPNQQQCPRCRGCRSGAKLHLTATAVAGKPVFTWEYCDMCGGRGWIRSNDKEDDSLF